MNVAYKKAKDDPSAAAWIPKDWPTQVREIGSATSYAKEPGPWTVVDVAAYKAYVVANQSSYDAVKPVEVTPVPTMSFFGAESVPQQNLGSLTAPAVTYGDNERQMLGKLYQALKKYGLIT